MKRSVWSAASGAAVLMTGLLLITPAASGADPSGTDVVRGSVWMQRNGADPATYYMLNGDGTLLAVDPYHGYGVGVWQPTGDRSLSSVLVFADVDPERTGVTPGVATFRSESTVDEAGKTLDIRTEGTYEPADGTAASTDSTTLAATRLWLASMPPEASATTPPDPGLQPTLGPGYGDGRGTVELEPYDPPNHTLNHADGTWFSFNAWVGPAIGLWWPTGDSTAIVTAWFTDGGPDQDPLVGEGQENPAGTGGTSRYGTSAGYYDVSSSTYMRLGPTTRDGSPLPSPDPALWPTLGSAWLVPREGAAPSLLLMYADGTVVHVDPDLGTGLGLWQPAGDGKAVTQIRYNATYPGYRYRTMPGVADLQGEMTIDETAGTSTMTYGVAYSGGRDAGEPLGTMAATRIQLEPATP